MKKMTRKLMAVALSAILVCGFFAIPSNAADTMSLEAKAQILAETGADSASTSMRLIAGVDSLEYLEVGFYVDGTKHSTTCVYETLSANGSSFAASDVIDGAAYLAVVLLADVPQTSFGTAFMVQPYWVDLSGTEVKGDARYISVDNGYAGTFYKVVDVEGSDIGAALVGIAFDADAVKYVGYLGGKIFQEYEVNAKNGVAKFVANVEDVTANAPANGTLIVLKFQENDEAGIAAEYDMTVESQEFCNVAEEDVTDVTVTVK